MASGGQARPIEPEAPQPEPQAAAAAHQAGRLVGLGPDWLPLALLVGDAVIVVVAVVAAYLYHHTIDPLHTEGRLLPAQPYIVAIPVVIGLFLLSLTINHQYQSWRGRSLSDLLLGLYSGIGLAAVLILAGISLGNVGTHYSRLVITYVVVITVVLMTAERYFLRQYETNLRRRGIGTEQVLIVGTGTASEVLVQRISMFPQYGYHVSGVLDDHLALGSAFAGAPVVGRIDDLPRKARELGADQVFIATAEEDRGRLLKLIKLCEDQQLEFKVVPSMLDIVSTRAEVNAIDGLPLVGIRRSRLRGTNAMLKRAIDVTASSIALVILAIPLLIVAAVVKITSPGGPVLFRQERIGMDGRPFTVLKFRTMIPDAEAKTGPKVAEKHDPRATPIGRLMRKLSIDELPQFWNVLRGDMSLVGPRPQPTFFHERYSVDVPRYLERQRVRPGLTGWAEVNDLRGAAPIADRTIYDVYYIENWSLALDLKIMMLTALRMFFQRHAY